MANLLKNSDQNRLEEILKMIGQKYHVPVSDFYSKRRMHNIAHARFMVWSILHWPLGWSTTTIGFVFSRDHSTVLYGLQQAKKKGLDKEARKLWKITQQNTLST